MTKLKIMSINVRGLGAQHKRRDVMNYLRNMNSDILLLQDTHLTQEKLSSFSTLWSGKSYHSCYTYNSRGTSILIHRNVQHVVISEFRCEKGNYMLLQCKIGTEVFVIGSIYGPNRDEARFFTHLGNLIDSIDYDHIILGGDFNFVIDAASDSYGYVNENNVNARQEFVSVCDKHSLSDVWRYFNQNKQQFTWFKSTMNQGARLDMLYVSNHLLSQCYDVEILPGYRTDHSIVSMRIQVNESSRGPGLWKFNESLLKDEEYVKIVYECIDRTVKEYAIPVYDENLLSEITNYEKIQFLINDGLLYETMLMLIRGETVKYSKRKAKFTKMKEREQIKK